MRLKLTAKFRFKLYFIQKLKETFEKKIQVLLKFRKWQNIYSLENPHEFEFVVNNKGTKEIRCLNYLFRLKTDGKSTWNYFCTSHNCTASLSQKAIASEG